MDFAFIDFQIFRAINKGGYYLINSENAKGSERLSNIQTDGIKCPAIDYVSSSKEM